MQCDVCGTEVRPEHKFCMECGARLAHQPPSAASIAPASTSGGSRQMFDPATGKLLAIDRPHRAGQARLVRRDDRSDDDGLDDDRLDEVAHTTLGDQSGAIVGDDDDADEPVGIDDEPADIDADATKVLPALGRPETTFAPPDPTPGAGLPWSAVVDTAPAGPPPPPQPEPAEYPPWPGGRGYAGDADLYGSYDAQADQPTRVQYVPDPYTGPPSYVPANYAEPVQQPDPGDAPTGHLPATYRPVGYEPWEGDEPVERPAFRVKPLLIVAIPTVAAAVVAVFTPVVSITAAGGAASLTGEWKVNDFATNFTVTGIVVALTLLLGAIAWCGGFRWGAGMAGGAGAALAGWAVLPLGLAEVQLSNSEAALGSTAELTRDLGYWCLVGAGGAGLLVTLISLLRAGNDRRAGLDPWVAALGAIAAVVAAVGPLIPLNGADLDGNWTTAIWSSGLGADLPAEFFVARFVNVGLMLLCGVFGFLLVRRYGLGLAIAGAVGNGWLVLTAATGQTDQPLGPAYFNPGAEPNADGLFEPYVVTVAGVSLVFFFGLVAAAMAIIDSE